MIREAAIFTTAVAAILTLAACDPAGGGPHPVQQTVDAGVDTTRTGAPTTTRQVDPLSSTGTWLVPSQIPHGTYQITLNQEGRRGYWALCSDLMCEPGAGMISNDLVNGPGYVVIGPDAVAVELSRVTLTPVA